jgi:hypothetical protein
MTRLKSAIPDDPDDGLEPFDGLYAGEPAAFVAPDSRLQTPASRPQARGEPASSVFPEACGLRSAASIPLSELNRDATRATEAVSQ